MSTYQALLAQREALDAQIDAAKANARTTALVEIKRLVGEFDITSQEIYGATRVQTRQRPPAKYRDPESGATWSGRGRPPAWIEGKDRARFQIAATATQA